MLHLISMFLVLHPHALGIILTNTTTTTTPITTALPAASSGGFFSAGDVAALITAAAGIIVGIITARRNSKSEKTSADQLERANILENYGNIVKTLQEEVIRLRRQYASDFDSWDKERKRLIAEIESSKKIVEESSKAIIASTKEATNTTRHLLADVIAPKTPAEDDEDNYDQG